MAKYVIGDIFQGDFPITQHYGDNPQNYPMFTIPGHEGVDWGTPNGTPVIAPFDGIILRDTFNDKAYGNFTVIWDPVQHCAVWYCHLQDVTTSIGDKVTKGSVVGHTNNTGNSTGPHLHVNFVETDSLGNRLNLNNGKQGFLNILDPNLVEWKLGVPTVPVDDMPPYLKQLFTEKGLDVNNESQIRTFFQKAIDADGLKTNLDNANNQIVSLQNQLTMMGANNNMQVQQIQDLQKTVLQLQADLKSCQNQLSVTTLGIDLSNPFAKWIVSLLQKGFPSKQT